MGGIYLDAQSENDTLRSKVREVEDENQELRAQILTQKKTINGMKNELASLRLELNDVTRTSNILTDRIRQLSQDRDRPITHGLLTSPPLIAPPPVPPPMPPPRIRISPRQVGAGEALTTPLGVSVSSSPPRHRAKRENRQNFRRSSRSPIRRNDDSEPGPSSFKPMSADKSYFFGLSIIPQFQGSFMNERRSSGNSTSAYVSSSDSSDSERERFRRNSNNAKIMTASKDLEISKGRGFTKNNPPLASTRTGFNNYNLNLPNTEGRFFFSVPFIRKNETINPSTSLESPVFAADYNENHIVRFGNGISDCIQYTFPKLHEGIHHQANSQSVVTTVGQSSKTQKLTNRIFAVSKTKDCKEMKSLQQSKIESNDVKNSESLEGIFVDAKSVLSSSSEEDIKNSSGQMYDQELDGFQTDESSNGVISDVLSVSESDGEKTL